MLIHGHHWSPLGYLYLCHLLLMLPMLLTFLFIKVRSWLLMMMVEEVIIIYDGGGGHYD